MNIQDEKIRELEVEIARLKNSVAELKVLNEIAVTTSKATGIEQILHLIVQRSISAIKAEQGSILLTTKNKDEPLMTLVRQDDTSSLKHDYHIGQNITGWVLLSKKPLLIEDLSEDTRFKPTEEEKRDIHSVLCVPIWFEGEIIGVMMLINKKEGKYFTNDDLTLFSIISVQAGQLIKNLELQKETFQERKETEKLQELDKIKTNFFTNVSHEFRTPLTLIMGPAKQILESTEDNRIKEKAEIIFKSSKKLNRLVNQLLDLSRIEAGQMKLSVGRQNLIPVIKEVMSSFQSFAERKSISFRFNPSVKRLFIYIDRDKVERIINNLLSNAFKFTPEGGRIELSLTSDQRYANIRVCDSGIGIPKEKISKIFDRFYQVDGIHKREQEGTGIGLALSKDLIELHKGRIKVESAEGKGTAFSISLPLEKKHFSAEEICEPAEDGEMITDLMLESIPVKVREKEKVDVNMIIETGKPVLLLVEDNTDVRNYNRDSLIEEYTILGAVDGEDGLKKSVEQIPDLIISDVMMPKMDGFELCEKLKTDERTSHIPIILLTAKATSRDKITGYETGADDYIMKPFDIKELRVRIKNLINQRKKLREHFLQEGIFSLDNKNITSIDRKFLEKAIKIIHEHLSDLSFSVNSFASELFIGRTTLYKKILALVGEPPGDFIKRIRLSKAHSLLNRKAGNISEIALEVGFNNPAYFSECFKKQFGITPSRYQNNPANH
jgi:signal transduction histidine kinase/AraC-like DNA-binding protein